MGSTNQPSIMASVQQDKKYKVVMLGDSTVGKSSILYRLKFSSFSGKQESTIGCEFFAKPIPIPERPDNPVKLLIWDTAGQEVFRSFTPNFLRGALAGIICYDITNRESFEHAAGWLAGVTKPLLHWSATRSTSMARGKCLQRRVRPRRRSSGRRSSGRPVPSRGSTSTRSSRM